MRLSKDRFRIIFIECAKPAQIIRLVEEAISAYRKAGGQGQRRDGRNVLR